MSIDNENNENSKMNCSSSLQLISKEKQIEDPNKIILEVTNEGMDYLNKLNSNLIGIISVIGPEKSEKTYFSNILIGDKEAFDNSKSTTGIYMWGQPIAHGENTDLLVLDTEGLFKSSNEGTSFDKQSFTLSCLLSSIMIYNTEESISDCINNFTNLAKEALSSIKKTEGKDLTPSELPLVYFILHNINIDSNSANQQFRNMVQENPIFKDFFQNFKICVLKKAGDIGREMSFLERAKTSVGIKIEEVGSLDDQDYKQKAKVIKDQIMNDLEPKKINNCNLDGKCLFGLIQSFIDSLKNGENIILFNKFNDVLALCLSDVVDQINFSFTSDKLNEKMTSNTSFEETFLDICKVTFIDLINEQYDKFKSIPIVKISPSPNVVNGIKSIFRKCLDTLCDNIQSSIDQKSSIINETSKIEFTNKLEAYNIEKLLNGYTCFIYEKILSPLYEQNNKKIQNNDKILQILKNKICGTIEKLSPLIQGKVNKLIEENGNLKSELENNRKKYEKENLQRIEEINVLNLKIEKRDRNIIEKDLESINSVNIEKEKYAQLEEKYNREMKEKNDRIIELTKNSNSLGQMASSGVTDQQQIQLEALKNDYDDITNIFIKYKILVNKFINDKEFFFEDLLIDKSLSDLRKKYPNIFDLLTEKEDLENMKSYYDKKIERAINENNNLKEKIAEQLKEIANLSEKLDEANKIIEERNRLYDAKESNMKNLLTSYDNLESKIKEKDLLIKIKDKQIIVNDSLMKEKNKTYLEKETLYMKEIYSLSGVIESMFKKDKSLFEVSFYKLSTNSQKNLTTWASLYKFKWS